jgi:phage shock protein C
VDDEVRRDDPAAEPEPELEASTPAADADFDEPAPRAGPTEPSDTHPADEGKGAAAAAAPPPPPPPSGQQQPVTEKRVLRRSRDDRVIGGVAGGLGRYFGIDPILLRIVFVVLVFAGGSGILLYLIGWIVIPQETAGDPVGPPPEGLRPSFGAEALGLVLIALGAFFLLRLLLPDLFATRYLWPVVLIAIGVALLLRGSRR